MHMMNRPIHLGLELADNHRVSRATNAVKLQTNTTNTNKHQSYYSSSRGRGNPFSSIFRLSKRWFHGLAGSLHVAIQVSDAYETGEGQRRRNVFVEVERAVGLPRGGRRTAPFVILFLNGTEIGRTPPVKVMENQAYTWVDETYEFPVCDGCRDISFQLWNMKSNDEQVGEFLGEANISVESIIEKQREAAEEPEDFPVVELSLDLKLWSDSNDDRDDGRSCCCPLHRPPNGPSHISTPDETKNDAGEYAQAGPPKLSPFKIHAASQRSRHPLRRPPEAKATTKSPYRIPNPDPYRRRDVRGAFDAEVGGSCLSSTFCRALGLIGIYLLFGVMGFSVCFEDLSIRDGLYLSVVTFSTVGFGDVPIKTKGGKLFSCVFALAGIGIIGIALGYIGQQLVQAQMLALQMANRKRAAATAAGEADAEASRADKNQPNEQPLEGESSKKGLGQRQGPDLQQSNSAGRQLLMSIAPIVALILIGSLVVGRYEGWDVVDSIYWCVITGTSVGFGDRVPQTGSMRWFCIIYIPLAVGAYSAALGRIANIFVEREIRKSNAKLLRREVTLEDLETMNDDGDGEVSPLEFVEHMLKSMNKVDQGLLDDLHRQFEVLDADGSGGLQEDDIIILTERKLSERRQKILVKYRDALLRRRGSTFGRISAQIHPMPGPSSPVSVPGCLT